jgi:hypothetical protein
MSFGQVIFGFSWSTTVTEKLQFEDFPPTSVAVQVTGVVPFGNVAPDGGAHTIVTPGQLSVAVAA